MGTSATELSPLRPQIPDQRLSPRKRLSQPIAIELLLGKNEAAWLHDVGEGGLSVFGTQPLELGTITSTTFRLPDTDLPIETAGVVAWSNDAGRVGVRFTRVEPDSTLALRRWLRNGALVASESSIMKHAPDAELASRISCLSEVADLQSVISNEKFDCDAALNLIVRRMTELTRASGAAIALCEGQDVVCRARAGNAPDVGVKLSPTSLSGQCFHSGTIVMLEDSENDTRVNPELCRQLNFRSLLVVPIACAGEIIGIAEVLSPNAGNFAGGDVLVLSFLTDLIASVALPRFEPDLSATPPVLPLPFQDLPPVTPEAIEVPDVNLEYPNVAEVAPAIGEAAELHSVPTIAPIEEPADLEPDETVAAFASEIPEIVESARWQTARELTLPIERAQRDWVSRLLPLAATIIVLLATAALLAGYYFSRSLNRNRPAPAAPVTAPTPTSTIPSTALSVPVSLPVSESLSSATTARRAEEKISAAPVMRPAPVSQTAAPVSAETELQVIQGSTHRPVVSTDSEVPEAPAVGTIASRGAAPLPSSIITAKTATPELQPAVLPSGVVEGKLIRKVLPRYPEMARSAGVSGNVVLSAKIATDGTLQNIKVLSGSPLLREAAIEAARQWRYSPYKLDGKPVETETRITLNFHR